VIESPELSFSSSEFFDAKYLKKSDPWNFSSDAYELSRYEQIISSISDHRYRNAFEPGCSIGVLTEKLAASCDGVTACDFSATAALQAKERCASLAHVNVHCASITDHFDGEFDLLVLSEIGYYFSRQDWQTISWHLMDRLAPGAVVIAAHWLGRSEHHSMPGDDVHDVLCAHHGIAPTLSTRSQTLRVDRFVRL
jgi:hypothetical protein